MITNNRKKIDDVIGPKLFEVSTLTDQLTISGIYYELFGFIPTHSYKVNVDKIEDMSLMKNKSDDQKDIHSDYEYVLSKKNNNGLALDQVYLHDELMKLDPTFELYYIDYIYIMISITNKIIVLIYESGIIIYSSELSQEKLNEFKDCLKVYDCGPKKVNIGILTQSTGSFDVTNKAIKIVNIDVDKTYNDDLPVDKINELLRGNESSLLMFYGEPGTGKTTFIRYLIQENQDTRFIILDANLLVNITSASMLETLIRYQDVIYVLEDCEKLLCDREKQYNPIISSFLNLTDGILGNVIRAKFICTFNTNLENIDQALLRKGRLKLKYEFKKLNSEKVNAYLHDNMNHKEMTIAELMHMDAENDYSVKKQNKIGF